MRKVINFIRDRYLRLTTLLLFIITVAAIVFSFPRSYVFFTSYENGELWNHPTLETDFDFSIIKTENDIAKDKEEIRKAQTIYYTFDDSKKNIPLKKAEDEIRKNWEESSMSLEQVNVIEGLFISEDRDSIRLEKHVSTGLAILSQIYQKGIIDIDASHDELDSERLITIQLHNDKKIKKLSELLTYSTACDFANKELKKTKNIDVAFLFSYLRTNLKPNILFNEKQTNTELKDQILNIPTKKGKIKAGTVIIKRGETINNKSFQILNSYKYNYEKQSKISSSFWLKIIGQLLIVTLCLATIYFFIRLFEPKTLNHIGQVFFILLLNILIVLLFRFVLPIEELNIYLIPVCIYPIILRAFYKFELALFLHFILVFIISLMLTDSHEFVLIHGIAGALLLFGVSNQTRRDQFINSALVIFLSYATIYLGMYLLKAGNLNNITWTNFAWFGGNALLSLFAYPLIYLFEKLFGLLSDLTLVELADSNSPLLRELNEKAPGTFQHSLQVANLAEEAVREINGNALLIRAGAMYHDIGKMKSPEYFIENQSSNYNPHDDLDCEESAKIIIDHVIYGVELGKKYKLPDQLLNFIRTHHGTTRVAYFYHKKVQEVGIDNVNPADYTYPGPLPFSKETAVLMMADSVEAASRSISDVSSEKIDKLIDKIITNQMNSGQFKEAEITFKDITKIKKIFARKLKTIYHVRIEYPE